MRGFTPLAGGKMYWTETITDKMQRATLDSEGHEIGSDEYLGLEPVTWTKYPGNPVLTLRLKNGITTPYYELWRVLYDEKTGFPAGPIGCATSLDGVNWERFPGIILDKGSIPAWDWWGIFGPTVLLDGDEYITWYSGVKIDFRGVHLAIGHAIGHP
jgi:hypothetical protein